MLVVESAKALALKLNDPNRVLECIPKARQLPSDPRIVVVPHRIKEAQRLKELGFNPPSPIGYQYDWPGRFTPFAHQKSTADFLTLHKRCLVLNSIGTGKTVSSLWAADYLMNAGVIKKVLILSPLSTLERVWGDAIFKEFYHRKSVTLYGDAKRRLKLLKTEADFYIINHDGFPIIAKDALDMFDLVIIDEAAVYRNPSTKRFKQFYRWLQVQPDLRLWLMTGTPTPNEPTDAWALAKLVDSPHMTKSYTGFREQVMTKIGQWKFIPRPDSVDIVKHVLQPSIRFTREDCLDLPDTITQTRKVDLTAEQAKHFKQMVKQLVTEVAGGTITAVNEAVKAQKLLQIACISRDTEVLTDCGWLPIQDVTAAHRVWDGCEWVAQDGAIYKGYRPTIELRGVRMTADHKVWAGKWITAGEAFNDCGLDWPDVRVPDSTWAGSENYGTGKDGAMALQVRLWEHSGAPEPISAQPSASVSEKLRVLPWEPASQADQVAPISDMVTHEAAVHKPSDERLVELRRPRHPTRSDMARLLPVLEGHGPDVLAGAYDRPDRQRRTVLTDQLPLDYTSSAGAEQTHDQVCGHPVGTCVTSASSTQRRPEAGDSRGEVAARVDYRTRALHVYDLVNCGPRNRFVVRGAAGELTIVHNCGVAYGENGELLELDCGPRISAVKEVIEEAGEKVILFVPLTGTLRMLERELSKQWTVGVVNGEVSSAKRNDIFHNFQHARDPRILIAHPATMAHGLTLTAASTVVWYGPITSNEQYVQANGRVERIGKKHVSNVVHIEATEVEHRIYERLQNKQKLQGVLLDLIAQMGKE